MHLHKFLLHLQEVGEREGEEHHDEACVRRGVPVEVIHIHWREKPMVFENASLILRQRKDQKESFCLTEDDSLLLAKVERLVERCLVEEASIMSNYYGPN